MDRDLVLAGLVALSCGPAIGASTWWRSRPPSWESARHAEGVLWRQVLLPILPAALLVAALLGWALVEPEASDERIPDIALIVIFPFLAVCIRGAWRAVRSLWPAADRLPAATVGLWRPRVVVSEALRESLDSRALAAALAHERAHVRHRDPLRMWLAQLATDLQWPWPSAAARFAEWREGLELARDEEARATGADGADLAAAVLTAVRLVRPVAPTAQLASDPRRLERRLRRLLAPPPDMPSPRASARAALSFAFASVSFFALGTVWGDALVHVVLERL